MIIQACINGARARDFHPTLPLTTSAMVCDAVRCVEAGAAELHVHPRNTAGQESLGAVDEFMAAIRCACPGTLVGVSTGAWIEGDQEATRRQISNWENLPDYASVNLSEPDAPGVIALLFQRLVGVEAGLATVEDARRFVTLPNCRRVFRLLIEIEHQDQDEADRVVEGIAAVLAENGITRPILLHGFDATVWHFVRSARKRLWSTRVGLEDGKYTPTGEIAPDNAALVRAAAGIFR